MHAEHTVRVGGSARSDGAPTLTAIVPLARPALPDARSAPPKSLELPVTGTAHDERSLSVRYQLDTVTHRWVASVMDDKTGEVVKTTLRGEIVLSLPFPDFKGYDDPKYAPTWVSVFEERFGGNGDI